MPATVKVTGGAETARALKALGRASAATKVLRASLRPGARAIATAARRGAPRMTGALAKSVWIGTRRAPPGAAWLRVGHRGQRARISHLVEFGTVHAAAQPYMRPAAKSHGGQAFIRRFGKEIWPRIAREGTRLAVRHAISAARRARRGR